MTAEVTQKLQSIIRENGRAVVRDPKRCEDIMAGELADFASSARALRLALRCGIPAALATGAPPEAEIARWTGMLTQQGLSGLKARDAIDTWAEAIGTGPGPVMEARPAAATPANQAGAQEARASKLATVGASEPGRLKPAASLGREPWRWVAAILLISLAAGATAGGLWPLGALVAFAAYCVGPSC